MKLQVFMKSGEKNLKNYISNTKRREEGDRLLRHKLFGTKLLKPKLKLEYLTCSTRFVNKIF